MQKTILFLFFILSFCSCRFQNKPSLYKGYIRQDGSTYYKYIDLGIKTRKISQGETMELFIDYTQMNDSTLWNLPGLYSSSVFLTYDSLAKSNNYLKVLLKCNEGDSINFIVKKSSLVNDFLNPCYTPADSMMKLNVRVIAILDSNQLKTAAGKHDIFAKNKELREQYELKRYLMLNNIPDSDNKEGIYLIPIKEGKGPEVTDKCRVSISYRGYFINNKLFDSIPVREPLEFTMGDEEQVINGLEKGIKKMREGEVAKIIIPSHSAFGEKGSSTGIVPPYTTVVYEVTMLKVNRL